MAGRDDQSAVPARAVSAARLHENEQTDLIELPNFTNEISERLVHVDIIFGRSFEKLSAM